MKICLLNPPSTKGYIRSGRWLRQSRANQQWYPIWLGYATALLEREGHSCMLLDACVEGLDEATTIKKVREFSPDFIAFYFTYNSYKEDIEYADTLQEHLAPVILVGPWSFCVPNALDYAKNVRLMTFGEFAHTLLDVVNGKAPNETLGLIWKDRDGVSNKNEKRPLCSTEELDRIPFVTQVYKKFLNIHNYRQTSFHYPFVDLLGAMGCPHNCTFCLWVNAFQGGPSYRPRSIKNVIDELWWIKHNLPKVKQIHFQDDTLPPKRAKELSQAIIDEHLSIIWSGYSRVEQDLETLKLMHKSGCETLHVGYETIDPQTLNLIQKGITPEQILKFTDDAREAKVSICAGFMIFPWQSKETVWQTIRWAKKNIKPYGLTRFSFTQLYAYPNTPICKTSNNTETILSPIDMTQLEKEGLKTFYLYNPRWYAYAITHPSEWRKIWKDALGVLHYLQQ